MDLKNSSILITGGTGSFGQRFLRTLLDTQEPARVVVFSRDEHKHHELENSLDSTQRSRVRFFIGDVRDRDRLLTAMRGIDYVVHAAALKHVSLAEYNPFECIQTNVIGAENVAQAAILAGVKKVVALSTDKAANPVNLYGASKLASDKIFIAANSVAGSAGTRFSVVRYGNVVNSRGSVVPFFRKLIEEGGDHLPITDERMTRFLITLEQGVAFVLTSMASMQGGEVFVPKIPSVLITDLARAIAPDLQQRIVGIRPGEKLHEVMISSDDSRNTFETAGHYVIEPSFAFWSKTRDPVAGGTPVSEGFTYTSDGNPQFLSDAEIRQIIASD
jgi:UDP-N-acetylglucosamine 4,6-dehydratase/5-epimerase